MFGTFDEAKRYVNGSVGNRAKIRDITRIGSSVTHGGPKTYELYLLDPGPI